MTKASAQHKYCHKYQFNKIPNNDICMKQLQYDQIYKKKKQAKTISQIFTECKSHLFILSSSQMHFIKHLVDYFGQASMHYMYQISPLIQHLPFVVQLGAHTTLIHEAKDIADKQISSENEEDNVPDLQWIKRKARGLSVKRCGGAAYLVPTPLVLEPEYCVAVCYVPCLAQCSSFTAFEAMPLSH